MTRPAWRRPSAWDAIIPTPAKSSVCINVHAEAERLAIAGVHPATVADPVLHGAIGAARGPIAEERVVRLLLDRERRPWWLAWARRGTSAEDRRGIDVRVGTHDVGELLLQVKSGKTGGQRFRRVHREDLRRIGVVVAPAELEDELVWARAMGALIRLREIAAGFEVVAGELEEAGGP